MYIRLKHVLSELTLQAARAPTQARFVVWLGGYAQVAASGEAVPLSRVQTAARALAAPLHWPVRLRDLSVLVGRRLLWRTSRRVSLARAYRPYWPYFHSQALQLYRATAHLLRNLGHGDLPEALYRGLVLFDFGLYFACHEYFEEMWRVADPKDRDFYHGLIQVAAAFYHYEKGNSRGALALLRRGLAKLAAYRSGYRGVEVERAWEILLPWEDRFQHGSPAAPPRLVVQSERPPEPGEGA
ncbi:MAG: DUF309 domain-containing protein [Armatimonadota bacterium]|nr:DUF309 domain-containing protein [Armatimonadota bacterium]MDR7440050.1 DUF309 domain-containing protein [Armatimonadota bacterium]MDR7562799.1 DUF309 domain-containing protein [Armatimonadota bacterium]MDR7567346.1 DUF309 domain-containing protein [Armatimonadota bacterium]MDR7601722.1 DUF309 domain-containing protein [Armatimonadota bacterium]